MDANKMTTCKKTGLPLAAIPDNPFANEPALPKATREQVDEYERYLASLPKSNPLPWSNND